MVYSIMKVKNLQTVKVKQLKVTRLKHFNVKIYAVKVFGNGKHILLENLLNTLLKHK